MIMGFVGARGSGKTASMVLEAYRYRAVGFSIYANLELSYKHEKYDAQMIETFASEQNPLKDAVVLVDEAHVLLDSRSSFTKRNKIISYFILQTRKRNVHLLYTTQSFHQIEKRLRDQSDFLIECSYDKEHDCIHHKIEETSTGRVLRHMIDAKPIFDLYDTNAIIDPFAKVEKAKPKVSRQQNPFGILRGQE